MVRSLLLFFLLLQPAGLFSRLRGYDLFRLALVLQFFRWQSTALTTMVTLYQERSPMLLPVPFGIDPERYRFIEIFLYGPYGMVIMTGIAYLVWVRGEAYATIRPMTFRKTWELIGLCFFAPWVPSLLLDALLVKMGLGGPAIIIPWHVTILAIEVVLTSVGLNAVFGIPLPRAVWLGGVAGAAFLVFAGLLIR
ncbi:MAG: hypothetical protein HQL90_10515 [Magnetococcales bacterium]|nr:hypothetical protein [Magnetococcales bacterium]